MAANHIIFNKQHDVMRQAVRGMQLLREGRDVLSEARAALIQMRDGDGAQAAHYNLLAAQAGFQAGDYADASAAAKASFDEIDSVWAKVATDGATSSVSAAISQAAAKHGV
jgi:hypothetical protein